MSRTSALKGNSILVPYTKPIPGSDEDVKGLVIQIHSNRELLIILRGCKERKAMSEQKISAMHALNAVKNRDDNQEKNAHPSVRKKSISEKEKAATPLKKKFKLPINMKRCPAFLVIKEI